MSRYPYRLVDNGDMGLTILFEAPISRALSIYIVQLAERCRARFSQHIVDLIPAYQSLTLGFNLDSEWAATQTFELEQLIEETQLSADSLSTKPTKRVEIPVCYGGEYGPDLAPMAQQKNMTQQSLINQHSQTEYFVHMLGFAPGFMYLGGLEPSLACPRKSVPAMQVPAGSLGIGAGQTGIYPQVSPGGWHIIGRTPLALFDVNNTPACIVNPLDSVRFYPISASEFENWNTP